MGIDTTNINIQPILTKEQIDFDKALNNMKYASAKLRISQERIDIKNVSEEELEIAIKLFDEMEMIQRDFNIEAQKIQQDVNNKMRELQEGANKKFADANDRYRGLITSMKSDTIEDKTEYCTQYCDTGVSGEMSKEKEEEIKQLLADELKKSQNK